MNTGLDHLPSPEAKQVSDAFTGSWMQRALSKEFGHPGCHSPIDQGQVAVCVGKNAHLTYLGTRFLCGGE